MVLWQEPIPLLKIEHHLLGYMLMHAQILIYQILTVHLEVIMPVQEQL